MSASGSETKISADHSNSKAEGKRLTKRKAMNIAAYHVWQALKTIEEAEAARREEEGSSDDDDDDDDAREVKALGDDKGVKKSASSSVSDPVTEGQGSKGEDKGMVGVEVAVTVEEKVAVVSDNKVGVDAEAVVAPKDQVEQMGDGVTDEKVQKQDKGEQRVITGKDQPTDVEKAIVEKIKPGEDSVVFRPLAYPRSQYHTQ